MGGTCGMQASDFGDMSDGMALYFFVLKAFVVLFFVLSLLAMPMLVIANAGNDGLANAEEPIWPGTLTLGNIGKRLLNVWSCCLLANKQKLRVCLDSLFFPRNAFSCVLIRNATSCMWNYCLLLTCALALPTSLITASWLSLRSPSFRLRPRLQQGHAVVPRQGRHPLVLLQAVLVRRGNYRQVRDLCDQLLRSGELRGADCGLRVAGDVGDSESRRNRRRQLHASGLHGVCPQSAQGRFRGRPHCALQHAVCLRRI